MPARNARYTAADVQDHVKQLILDRRLGPGDPLPTETEMMGSLSVSRNSVREALKGLQAMRIVEIRHGFGTYVGSLSLDLMIEGLTFRTLARHRRGENSLRELMELREALETGLIGRAIDVLPEEDPGVLRGLVDMMRTEAQDGAVHPDTERSFHLTLYRGLENYLLSELLDAFWDTFQRVRENLAAQGDAHQVARQHQEILDAVAAHDAERARAAVTDYFTAARKRFADVL